MCGQGSLLQGCPQCFYPDWHGCWCCTAHCLQGCLRRFDAVFQYKFVWQYIGRAAIAQSDWRSDGPRLAPGSRQFSLPPTLQVTRLLGPMVEHSLSHPAPSSQCHQDPADAPCSGGASQCISRELSPGHGGSDVFYHYRPPINACTLCTIRQAAPASSCNQIFGFWMWAATPFATRPCKGSSCWVRPARIELATFSVLDWCHGH